METMPYQEGSALHELEAPASNAPPNGRTTITTTDWQVALPVLWGTAVTLRELRSSDAASLLALLTTEEVSRFISPPPTTLAGFERFIAWTHEQRRAGQYVCFAVVPHGTDTAIGIFQLRALGSGFGVAEWGFAIGSPYWGTGAFADGASALLAFAFDRVGVIRLEARASAHNGRGNGALKKVGAVEECRLRQSFVKNGERHDQVLWALLASEWRARLTRASVTLLRREHGIH